MSDSQLNGAEQPLQLSFRKLWIFNGLLAGLAVVLAYLPIHELPDRKGRPPALIPLSFQAVELGPAAAPLHLAGSWIVIAGDPRFHGLSGLVIDRDRFLAVSDLGALVSFDLPTASRPKAYIRDLTEGPGRFGNKWSRDAESIARDEHGRGWWVGFEQTHSLWLYEPSFDHSIVSIDLKQHEWPDNRGAEGLLAMKRRLLVVAENGSDAIDVGPDGIRRLPLDAGAEVADAAMAPNGTPWLLLRSKGADGIRQWIAPLLFDGRQYRAGAALQLPKDALDNYEGMAIASLPDGRWRFWLITDDGHRFMARTLLVALDYESAAHSKSPATSAGPSRTR